MSGEGDWRKEVMRESSCWVPVGVSSWEKLLVSSYIKIICYGACHHVPFLLINMQNSLFLSVFMIIVV